MHALIATYRLDGIAAAEHAELCEQLGPSLSAVPGLVSLTWLENVATGRHAALYVFATKPDFDAFVASELYGLLNSQPCIAELAASDYAVRVSGAGDVEAGIPARR